MGEACFGGWSIAHGPQIWTSGEGRANVAALCLIRRILLDLAAGASLAAPRLLPLRVSWLVGWLTRLLHAEFLSKEGEDMPATPYHPLHLPRRRDTAVEKTAFTHSFVLGPE